jgi:hypothetical protein
MPSFLTKIVLTAGILSGSFFSGTAQIQMGDPVSASGRFRPQDIQDFKATTTLFVLQDRDYEKIEEFEKAISSAWKVTPYKIIRYSDIGNFLEEGKYSFFMFGWYSIRNYNMSVTYDLIVPKYSRKGEVKGADYLARIMLEPKFSITEYGLQGGLFGGKEKQASGMNRLYKEGVFRDWGPGYLLGRLKLISQKLSEGKTLDKYGDLSDKSALTAMRRDTLFIPDYVKTKPDWGDKEKIVEVDQEDLKEAYPYKVAFISSEELNDRIVNSEKPVYYLLSTLAPPDKYINIFSSKKGLIYLDYQPMSSLAPFFRTKDLKKVSKIIKSE